MDIVVQKNSEIDKLKKDNKEKEELIIELENKCSAQSHPAKPVQQESIGITLPKLWQQIKFKHVGEPNDEMLRGKVVRKQKVNSIHKNKVGIKFDNGLEEDYDFSTDIVEWFDVNKTDESLENSCCLHSFSNEKNILHENFLTVLTRAQVKGRPEKV